MCSSCQVAILAPKTCFFDFVCLYHLSFFQYFSYFIIHLLWHVVVFVSSSLFQIPFVSQKFLKRMYNIVLPCACITTAIDSSCDVFFAQVCALQHMIQACSASYLCLLCLSQYLFRLCFHDYIRLYLILHI